MFTLLHVFACLLKLGRKDQVKSFCGFLMVSSGARVMQLLQFTVKLEFSQIFHRAVLVTHEVRHNFGGEDVYIR